MKKKIVIYQQEILGFIPDEDIQTIQQYQPDMVCLPEYFFHPEKVNFAQSQELLKKYSQLFHCILIGGTTVLLENEKLYNTCFIYDSGREMGHYKKINLYYREFGRITPGTEYTVIDVNGIRIGLMICADALSESAWQGTALLKPEIVFIPTFSPYKEEKIEAKFIRDEEIYVSGAKLCGCPVIKTCCIGTFKDTRLQGRSLAALPDGILWRVPPDKEDQSIIQLLEIDLPD